MSSRKFDLNIEKILEDWEAYHALREIIANAIDEQILTKTRDIEIFKDSSGKWHVRDFGRGLTYLHLTQKENEEKLSDPHVIGKFGIGLKDALATLDRKQAHVLVKSKHGDITLGKSEKHGFEDIVTLHAYVSPPSDPQFIGTEFVFDGVADDDIARAKDLFLKFSGEEVIEDTDIGSVLAKKGSTGRIYINGVKVAEEDNFLFSYNITALTAPIRKALNRERTNVGRTAYSERVKSILTSCRGKDVAQNLVADLKNYETGSIHDELNWIDVQEHAVKILNAVEKVVFFTPMELRDESMMVDEAKEAGYEVVAIPQALRERIRGATDISGKPIRDMAQFSRDYQDSFEFKFVSPAELTAAERIVLDKTDAILRLIGGKPPSVKEIRISETMRKDMGSFVDREGVWEPGKGLIVIKRSALSELRNYAGTLLHEVAHSTSGAEDVDRTFELELTRLLGLTTAIGLKAVD